MPAVLLGVASAAIAFAFHETADRGLAWSLVPILGAVLCWAGSFASGVLFSRAYANSIRGNIALNLAEAANLDRAPEAKTMFKDWNAKTSRRYAAQQWLLLAGAVLYLIGHAWSIWDASEATHQPASATSSGDALTTPQPASAPEPLSTNPTR